MRPSSAILVSGYWSEAEQLVGPALDFSRKIPHICTPNSGETKHNRDMPTRIRLQRKGKKGRPYYHVVVADSRAPRDGKYIERIGAYDPNQNPAFVEVNTDKAMDWLQKGAQPSDTCRAILSYTGVVYKNHLANGVKKGAFDQEEADRRFDIWKNEKNAKIEGKKSKLAESADAANKDRVSMQRRRRPPTWPLHRAPSWPLPALLNRCS